MSAILIERLRVLRKQKQLHTEVTHRLDSLLQLVLPELHSVPEIQGLPGGRNDLIAYDFRGQSIVFEIFATSSQVSRDLLILERTRATYKIAILLDKEVDPKVLEQYLRQNPESPYPFLFVSEFFEKPPYKVCLKLRELIVADEEANFRRILLQKITTKDVGQEFQNHGVSCLSNADIHEGKVTYSKVLVTLVLKKCFKLGVKRQHLITLGKWLSEVKTLEFLFLKLDLGFNMLLYTDLDENIGFFSDVEIADWIRAADCFDSANVILSMNATVRELEEKYAKKLKYRFSSTPGNNSISLGMSQVHNTESGKAVIVSIPNDTNKIVILPPLKRKYTDEDYLHMVEICSIPDSRKES